MLLSKAVKAFINKSMERFTKPVFNGRLYFNYYVIVATGVLILTGVLNFSDVNYFEKYIGNILPLVAMTILSFVGGAFLIFLKREGGFDIYKKQTFRQLILPLSLVLLSASVAISVDLLMVFPVDVNVPIPSALSFYPSIAFLVEILFHVLPLSIVLFIANAFLKSINQSKLIYICIGLVAILEPTYQIFGNNYPTWSVVVVWLNLYFFNVVQLVQFKKGGFVSMYLLRLVYYLFWHIVWGYYRLELLF